MDSKPVHNYEYLAGRAIGIAGLLWFIVAVLVIAMQAMGFVAQTLNFGIADTFQFHSLLNLLLLDAPITLLIWSAFVVSLSYLVDSRIAVLATGLLAMFAWYYLVLNTPFEFLSIVSPSSNDSLFVSELVPKFASWPTVGVRIATILAGIGLIAAGARLLRRNDSGVRLPITTVSSLAFVVGGSLFAVIAAATFSRLEESSSWREVHQSYDWNGGIDVKQMTGELYIDPKRHLTLDVDMVLGVDTALLQRLVFTLNPGLKVQELSVDGVQATYSFRQGLLEVQLPQPMTLGATHKLSVVVRGVPNPRFAYLDSSIDYLNDSSTSRQAIMLLGKDGSVFDSEYVALMPGAYWYPVPGPVKGDYLYTQKGLDYFDVDLSIALNARGWRAVGTGATIKSTANDQSFRLTSTNPLHEVGLFASNFASASLEVNDTTFAMYLHKRHSQNIRLLQEMEKSLRTEIEKRLQLSNELGFSLPHGALSFVEVPRRLRTVGGGWRMNSVQALPSVYLLKEHAFPTARMDLAFARTEQSSNVTENAKLEQISGFFSRGIATDNPWSSWSDILWSHMTFASGEYSHELHQVMLCLLAEFRRTEQYSEPQFFSMYSLLHFAELMKVSLFESSLALMDGMARRPAPGSIHATLALRELYPTRLSLWDEMEQTSFSEFPTSHGNEHDLEILLLKASLIANGLLTLNGDEKVAEWMAAIRKNSAGNTYTLEDVIQLADDYDVVIDPFLTTWLRGNALPGYVASSYTTVRVADDAYGNPRYQTTVDVRNTQPVSGIVRLEYPSEHTWDWNHHYIVDSNKSDGVLIEGGSAKRISLVTRYDIRKLYLDPGPSLNRSPFALVKRASTSSEQVHSSPKPFVEESTWSPARENGIVVDDLDSGFSVSQPRLNTSRRTEIGPMSWLGRPVLEAEIDRGLPLISEDYVTGITRTYLSGYRSPPGTWARTEKLGAFGRFRKTTAFAHIRDKPVLATFSTSLPQTANWRLDYHAPGKMSTLLANQETTYELVVSNGTKSWNIELDAYGLNHGWNSVGVFELDSGTVKVELESSTQGEELYADAIRWTRATTQ